VLSSAWSGYFSRTRFKCSFTVVTPHFIVLGNEAAWCLHVSNQPAAASLQRFNWSGPPSGTRNFLEKHLRHFLTERYRNWISWYLDVFPSWCRHFQYLGFLTGAPTTNFARKRVKPRYLTRFRATKNCVVICRASLLYEMGYPFRSALFVPMEFRTFFAPTCPGSFSKRAVQIQSTNISRRGFIEPKRFRIIFP